MYHNPKLDLDYALEFTALYQSESDRSLREAKCLRKQIPYVLEPIQEEDLLAGYMKHGFVGFSPQYGGSYTYYYWDDRVEAALAELEGTLDENYQNRVEEMRAFWRTENTDTKMRERFKERYGQDLSRRGYFYGVTRIAGMNVDLDLLIHEGLPGLRKRIEHFRKINTNENFYTALELSIDSLADACLLYAGQAQEQAKTASEPRKKELAEMEAILRRIAAAPPATFKEALQLIWIYAVCSDLMNFGRMDNYLSDFYVRDLDAGILDEEEAIRWLSSFYRSIIRVSKVHDSRILIGGRGRKDEAAADRLALALIEVSKRVLEVVPQLTLRYYRGINPELMKKTLENIAAGAVYPIVYSDEVTLPAMEKMYRIDPETAEKWVPFGCGEYTIEGYGAATPNTGLTCPTLLDALLHHGRESFFGQQVMKDYGAPEDFETFDQLFAAYEDCARETCAQMAVHEQLNYQVAGEESDYLHLSLLVHDCLETGKGIFSGGCRYLCATDEIFGFITFADSMMAIKRCVYEEKRFSLSRLVEMLDANFEGFEQERALLLAAPKYGNDDDEADEMAVRLFHHLAGLHAEGCRQTSLHYYGMVSVNNSGSAERGAVTAATPCGRKRSEPLSNGNSPSLGADVNGLTATLNSMSKFDPCDHVGVVHNIRFNKDMLKNNMDKVRTLLEIFYENGGAQTNLSSIGRGDLEQALIHPEQYQNLIVRIGGFSARFIELDPIVQHELILRTTYEEC